MQQYVGPILLCLFPAIVSFFILFLQEKEEMKRICISVIMAFSLLNMGIISMVKFLLGDKGKTIFESFWDIEYRTYIHYSVPILIIAIILPFLFRWILRDKFGFFILWMLSITLCVLCICIYIYGKAINEIYCIVIFSSTIAALFLSMIGKHQMKANTFEKDTALFSLKVEVFSVFSILIFNPSELFLSNIREFPVKYSNFIFVLIAGSCLIIFVYMVLTTCFMNKICCNICNYGIFSLTFIGYLQGMFFNGKMLALDGSRQEWSQGKIIINICVWGLIFGAVVALKVFIPKADKYMGLVCIYVTLIQMATLVMLCITTEFPGEEENYALTTEARWELHSKNNVLVFILDWYDEQILERIAESDSSFLEPLSDFTWYQNTTSNYAFTDMSLPYLLTNIEWKYDMPEGDYCKYAYENSQFLQDIAKQNYDIGIYTGTQYVDQSMQDLVINYSKTDRRCNFSKTISFMAQCSKYKQAPFIVKNMYWYATSDMIKTMEDSNIYVSDNYSFYQSLIHEQLEVNGEISGKKGSYRFYHLDGAHAPFVMTQDFEYAETDMLSQAKGSMKVVYEYIHQLKKLGLYDNATIIITADHGQNTMVDDAKKAKEEGFEPTSSPILLVKEKNQKQGGISEAQVSHREFAATVMQAIKGEDNNTYGKSFKQVPETETRERVFIFRRHNDMPYRKYMINGDVRDITNWILAEDMR